MRALLLTLLFGSSVLGQAQTFQWDWAKHFSTSHVDHEHGLAIDPDGNLLVLGEFQGDSLSFGDTTFYNPNQDYRKAFVCKYTPEGELLWVQSPTGGRITPTDITTDAEGNVIIVGSFDGYMLHFAGLDIMVSTLSSDLMIVKLDGDGNGLWGYCQGGTLGTQPDFFSSVAVDSQGNIFALGATYSANIEIGDTDFSLYGPSMLLLVKFSPDGVIAEAIASHCQCSHGAYTVCTDEQDHVLVGGWFFNTPLRFGIPGSAEVTTAHSNDIHGFIFRFDNALSPLWGRSIGGTQDDRVTAVTLDGLGHVYAGGTTLSSTVNTGVLSAPDPFEGGSMLARYDLDGNAQWLELVGDSIEIQSMAVDDGRLYAWSNLKAQLPVAFGDASLQAVATYNSCLLVYDTDGSQQTALGVYSGWVWVGNITTDEEGAIYLAGRYAQGTGYVGPFEFPHSGIPEPGYSDMFLVKLHPESDATGVTPLANADLEVWPLPATDRFHVRTTAGPIAQLRLLDATGRLVSLVPGNGQGSLSIPVDGLVSGLYRVECRVGERLITRTVLIAR